MVQLAISMVLFLNNHYDDDDDSVIVTVISGIRRRYGVKVRK